MTRFPITEAYIVALAQAMESGLGGNAMVYPAPSVDLTAHTVMVVL